MPLMLRDVAARYWRRLFKPAFRGRRSREARGVTGARTEVSARMLQMCEMLWYA